MREPPYYINYSKPRLLTHNIITSKYFDLAIAAVIGLNVVTMAMEFYMMPYSLEYALKIFNYFFTAVFILEAFMKIVALGLLRYLKNRWNQLDVMIVALSIAGIILEKMESDLIPINPTIIRVFRVLRIARVLKLLKMAKGIRALLDTVMQALPQVGNLGLLFFLLFFIFAALGVELFGRLECTEELPCEGLGEHAHFKDFGMAFLTLFRVATGDNWNGIMKDTLRDNCDYSSDCIKNCCISPIIAPIYFVVFVLMAQFVLVNVVVAVLMKHLEESHKHMDDDMEMDAELERELAAEVQQKKMAELEAQVKKAVGSCNKQKSSSKKHRKRKSSYHKPLVKMASLPPNFVFTFNNRDSCAVTCDPLDAQAAKNSADFPCETESVIAVELAVPICETSSSKPSPLLTPDVNLRQASPDETESKVSVANLSPIPLRASFGPTLHVPSLFSSRSPTLSASSNLEVENNAPHLSPNLEKNVSPVSNRGPCGLFKNQPQREWTCILTPSNSDSYKVQLLPVVHKDEPNGESHNSEETTPKNQNLSASHSVDKSGPENSNQTSLPSCTEPNKSVNCFDSNSLTDSGDIFSSPVKSAEFAVRTGKVYDSGECEASYSSSSDVQHNEEAPLIVKRLRKKLLMLAGESSCSSQSDAPDDSKDKSAATDSTSLEC